MEFLNIIKSTDAVPDMNIDFNYHYIKTDDEISSIAITYMITGDGKNERLRDYLNIENTDDWNIYKFCLISIARFTVNDLKRRASKFIRQILKTDNKKKLICIKYDQEFDPNYYREYIKDILNFNEIHKNDMSNHFNELYLVYDNNNNLSLEYFNNTNVTQINQPSQLHNDILPVVSPQLIRTEAIIPEYQLQQNDNNQSIQSAGATPEQLIQFQELALKMLSYGSDTCNLTQKNEHGFTAYNYAVKHRLLDVVYEINKLLYTNTNLYDTIKSINVPNTTIVNDYVYGDDIDINDIEQYFAENTDKVVFKYDNNYTIIHLDQIKPNIIDAKRYTCNKTSNLMYKPPDKMIDRINPIFHTEKIGNIPINGGVLFKDIISIDTNMSRFYELEDTNNSYISFVSSLLVDSATTESAVSMTHCNPGATGKIYRLVPLQVDITQSGGIKIKYIRKKSHKRHSSKKKTSKIKSSTKRKSSKRKSIKRK
jgi:hypothetical protein